MRRVITIAAAATATALTLAACGSAPSDSNAGTSGSPSPSGVDYKACMVSDSGGFDDRSFNESAKAGLDQAVAELGLETLSLESKSDADYQPNINQAVQQGCDMIVTVGFLLGDATEGAAKANPDIDFAIVDYAYDKPPANLKGLVFATEQSAFLGGYLAAGMTKSGTVATYGGLQIPSVTSFMTGYYQGVQYYNDENGKSVKVLGWNPDDPKKSTYAGGFDDQNKGKQIANNFIQQGADIILPVAGPVGLGTAAAAQASGGKVSVLWVDTDGCVSAEQYCDVFLSSVMKGLDTSVSEAVHEGAAGTFTNELYVGTLANDGTKLAPYHDFESKVPQELADGVDAVKQKIIDGEITVKP